MNRPDIAPAWHAAYSRWYDADRGSRPIAARAWGVVADSLVRIGDRLGLWGAR